MVAVGDRGRKLRARGVTATSAKPALQLLLVPFSFSHNRTVSQDAEAPRRSTATTSKGAPKRAAAIDNSSCSSSTAHLQQTKKRLALANLMDCSNIPSTRNAVPPPQKFVSIQSFIEVDHLYALPHRRLELYDTTGSSGYRIYEAFVHVNLKNPTQLCMGDLQDITIE